MPDTDSIPEEAHGRLAVVAAALTITPGRPDRSRRGGLAGVFFGDPAEPSPSVTDALRIARFACDDYRDIDGVDALAPEAVTAADLLDHLTRKDA